MAALPIALIPPPGQPNRAGTAQPLCRMIIEPFFISGILPKHAERLGSGLIGSLCDLCAALVRNPLTSE